MHHDVVNAILEHCIGTKKLHVHQYNRIEIHAFLSFSSLHEHPQKKKMGPKTT